MWKQLRVYSNTVRQGFNNGLIAGAVLVFLTLIGLPAGLEGRAALATLALPLFVLIMIAFGVRTVRQHGEQATWEQLISNGVALGVAATLVFLLFMALINRWQARNFPVQAYFAEVTLGTTSRLSGVPQSELFPNPPVDPVTQTRPPGAKLRTNPMRLTLNDDHITVFNFGFIKFGGLYGTALVLGLIAMLTVIVSRALQHIHWRELRDSLRQNYISVENATRLAEAGHWLRLLLPTLLFFILWSTVSINYDTSFWRSVLGEDTVAQMRRGHHTLFDLHTHLNMELRARQNVQLILAFGIIISLLVAWRSLKPRDYQALPYLVRAGTIFAFIILLFLLAAWRIQGSDVAFISPTLEILGLNRVTPENASLAVAFLAAVGLSAFALLGNRDPLQFESVIVVVTGIGLLAAMPLFMDQYQTAVLNLVAIYIMLGLGLNIVVGYAGLLDLGYVAFFAVGAYMYSFVESTRQHITVSHANDIVFALTTSLIVVPLVIVTGSLLWNQRRPLSSHRPDTGRRMAVLWQNEPPALISLGLVVLAVAAALVGTYVLKQLGVFDGVERASPFLLGLVLALIVSAFAGLLLGFPVLRLRSDYLAIVTLGFGEIISISAENLEGLTGGPFGAQNVPRPLPEGAGIAEGNLVILYLGILGAALVTFFSLRLRSSRLGRAWTALKSDEDIAQAMGVNLVNAKLLAFATGAAFAGAGGLLFAARQSNLFPNNFTLIVSINVLAMVIIGGMGSVPGVIVGAIVLVGLPEMLRAVRDYRVMAFGALLVVMMLIRPAGMLPAPLATLEERAQQLRTRLGSRRPALNEIEAEADE